MPTPEDVLSFWFGPIAEDGSCSPAFVKRWWAKDEAFDREVTQRFGAAIAAAEAGRLASWRDTPRGLLALVILCDQMTRNSRRGSGAMYDADPLAQDLLRLAIQRGDPEQLRTMERYFLYMPLMHAESRELQQQGVERFDQLAATAEPGARDAAAAAADYMRRHEVIVARFGRFPHRNELLGRTSTDEEREFLKQPGSSF
jgi:uncharacterized protein (DUF924 family)